MSDATRLVQSHHLRRRNLLKFLASASASATLGRSAIAQTTTADRRDDVRIVREALTLHPGVLRYLTLGTFHQHVDRFEHEFIAAAELETQYLVLSRFLATLRCGHTYANFFNQRSAVADALFDRSTRLPFEFRWLSGQLVVTRPYPNIDLAAGTVIDSINGVDADRLLSALLPYVRADGHNDGKRRTLLSVRGHDSIEYFDVFQGLLHPPNGRTHKLIVRTPNRDGKRVVELPTLDLAGRRAQRRPTPNNGLPIWSWAMRADGIAILSMPSWSLYSAGWPAWPAWLDQRLDSLTNASGLVIDLRDNEGGDDCGNNILARLAPRDWSFGQSEERVRFRRTPATLDPYLDTWDEAFRSLGETATATNEGFYRRPSNERSTRLRAKLPRITGPVAALIGPANSSATHQFAERAKQTGWIRLFGTETGGNRRGINGGAFFFVRLPATGLEFDLPLIGYFPHAPQPDAGVVPDVLVPETVDDVINGRDRALDSAVDWILTKSRAYRPFAITDARTGQSHGPMSPSAPALLM